MFLLYEKILGPPDRNVLGLINIEVQTGKRRFAPLFFSTLLPKIRYQMEADFREQCRYFRKKIPMFCKKLGNTFVFSVLHKVFTIFAYKIRAPPFEV